MDLKPSSSPRPELSLSDGASDPEDKELSEGEDDDDRNHKHRKRESGSQSLDCDFLNQVASRTYRKRKFFDNGFSQREGDPQSVENWKNHGGAWERDFSSRSDKRRSNRTSFSRGILDLNQRIRGNQSLSAEAGSVLGRGMDPLSWGLHNSRLGMVDVALPLVQPGPVPSGLLAGRGLSNISHNTSWNAFGMVPGVPNGGLDGLHHLGLQGPLRPSISPAMNIGLPRQRCRDFEERGFCLRGDMCPMEHGVNRIVVDDVQSLSQFNLPVSLPGSQLLGTTSANGALPVISTSSSSLAKSKAVHATSSRPGITEDSLGPNGGFVVGGLDVYDPDQPLWTTNNTEAAATLLAVNGSIADGKVSLLDIDPSNHKHIESYEVYDEQPGRSVRTTVSQSFPVWGKQASSRNRFGQRYKIDSKETPSSSIELDIKSEEAPSVVVSHQEKGMIVDDSNSEVKELSLKPRRDPISNIRKPSQKALRTLFVNGIPLKDNKKEALLSHFQKFGEVIDIYIPMNGERAFVQFSKREEAEAALMAPDAVMGNRFIKLWWANRDNTTDDVSSGNSNLPITSRRKIYFPGLPQPSVPDGRKENPHAAGDKDDNSHSSVAGVPVFDHLKPMAANISRAPPQQKKLESLELLKELRKKQEMLDQKRNEFRLQLNKLEKQSAGVKDVTASDQAIKTLGCETLSHHAKNETSNLSPRTDVIMENRAAEHAVLHATTSKPTAAVQPSNLRPIRQPAPLGAPFVGNRFKLDNRPSAFRIVSPFPAGLANVATLKEHFSSYGDLSSVELEESKLQKINDASIPSDVSARISFTMRRSAERAFLNGKCWQGHNLQFMWLTPTTTGKEGGSSGSPAASANMPSNANVHDQPGVDSTSIHSPKLDASGSSEPESLRKESDADSVEKGEDFPPVTTSVSSENNAS